MLAPPIPVLFTYGSDSVRQQTPPGNPRSDVRPSLSCLNPQVIQPCVHTSSTSRVLTSLKRIHRLEVHSHVKCDGVVFYRIRVFNKHQTGSHIPVHHGSRLRLEQFRLREPDHELKHSFSDFLRLRDDIGRIVRGDHGLECCAFCSSIAQHPVFGLAKPRWTTRWCKRQSSVCDLLTSFVNAVLELALRAFTITPDCCNGQVLIPLLVNRFLRGH